MLASSSGFRKISSVVLPPSSLSVPIILEKARFASVIRPPASRRITPSVIASTKESTPPCASSELFLRICRDCLAIVFVARRSSATSAIPFHRHALLQISVIRHLLNRGEQFRQWRGDSELQGVADQQRQENSNGESQQRQGEIQTRDEDDEQKNDDVPEDEPAVESKGHSFFDGRRVRYSVADTSHRFNDGCPRAPASRASGERACPACAMSHLRDSPKPGP